MRSLITALRTLTILPVPGKDTERLSDSLYWFPVAGLVLGSILYGVSVLPELAGIEVWHEGTAVLILVLAAVLTRCIHLDGLCDWADGFWGASDGKEVLKIMKDPAIGVFGGTALLCILLAKWVCLVRLLGKGSMSWIIAAYVISRTMQVVLAAGNRYAREGGGKGSGFIVQAGKRHLAAVITVAVIILPVTSGLDWRRPACLLMAWLITLLFGIHCRRRVNGVTGDLLGACSELTETAVLAVGAGLTCVL